jgi:hypothetical protein
MGLSAHERHVLDVIESKLADSDPRLTSMMARFTRLAAGQALPARERIHAVRRWVSWCPRPGRRRRSRGRPAHRPGAGPRWQLVWWLLWFAVSAALITVVLSVGQHGAGNGCTAWTPVCATRGHPHPPPGVHLR